MSYIHFTNMFSFKCLKGLVKASGFKIGDAAGEILSNTFRYMSVVE